MNRLRPLPSSASSVYRRMAGVLAVLCLVLTAAPVMALSPLSGVSRIAVGDSHACALLDSGRVKCWGNNEFGQLGNDSTEHSDLPVDVMDLEDVIAIGAGYRHTCALLDTGGVKCWGKNFLGALGDGTETSRRVPVSVSGLTGASAIAVGGDHTCAITTAGTRCWGYNGQGAVGANNTTNILKTPTPVFGGFTFTAITAGYSNTCGMTAAGAVYCWGVYDRACNLFGCGFAWDIRPIAVPGLGSGVAQLSAGQYFTCARMQSGGVKCWGDNYHGQLGDLGTENPDPFLLVDIAGLSSGVTHVSAGYKHACARMSNGSLRCWGENNSGILGNGSDDDAFPPVAVAGPVDYQSVLAGGSLSCGHTQGSQVRCWGSNRNGQLGDGEPWLRTRPVDVPGLNNVRQVSTQGFHTCAVGNSGSLHCWGANAQGQLGDGTQTDRATPVAVSGLGGNATVVSVGSTHSCAVIGGAAKCWGGNADGQLGDGSYTDRLVPVAVSSLGSGVAGLGLGARHSCAFTTSGAARCWGENAGGQLGIGFSSGPSNVPAILLALSSGVSTITGGDSHGCAVAASGGLRCWGDNSDGQLGNGTYDNEYAPIVLDTIGPVITVSAGFDHTCAIETNGRAQCWGENDNGQIGNGFSGSDIPWPQPVSGLGNGTRAIAAGGFHACALLTTGEVRCWGSNSSGQLGDGSTTRRLAPISVLPAAAGGLSITAGMSHSCVTTASGGVQCWGDNQFGQLGIGLRNYRVPEFVLVSTELFRSGFEPGEGTGS